MTIPAKPANPSLNPAHPLAASFRALWAFGEGAGDSVAELTGLGGDLAYVGSGEGQEWAVRPLGTVAFEPRLRAAVTEDRIFPFQLIAVCSDRDNPSDQVIYFYGLGEFATRYYSIRRNLNGDWAAIQLRFGTEPGAAVAGVAPEQIVTAIGVFESNSRRSLFVYDDQGKLIGSATDTSTVSSISADRESIGLGDTSSVSPLGWRGDVYLAGRTAGIWSESERELFAADPFGVVRGDSAASPLLLRRRRMAGRLLL